MPQGATLESTDKVVADLEDRLKDIDEKQDVVSKIYEDEAIVTVKLKKDFEQINDRNLAQIKEEIKKRMDQIRVAEVDFEQPQSSRRFRGGGGANPGANFERMLGIGSQSEKIIIKGRNFDRMRNVADDIRYYLENLSSISSVRLNVSSNRPELHLYFDPQSMGQYNVSLNTVAAELSTFQSEFSSGLKYKQGTDEYDIIIRSNESDDPARKEKNINDLKQFK